MIVSNRTPRKTFSTAKLHGTFVGFFALTCTYTHTHTHTHMCMRMTFLSQLRKRIFMASLFTHMIRLESNYPRNVFHSQTWYMGRVCSYVYAYELSSFHYSPGKDFPQSGSKSHLYTLCTSSCSFPTKYRCCRYTSRLYTVTGTPLTP